MCVALTLLMDHEADFDLCGIAASAEEALDREAWARCDLLLTDVTLPGMDGFAFSERVRAERPVSRSSSSPFAPIPHRRTGHARPARGRTSRRKTSAIRSPARYARCFATTTRRRACRPTTSDDLSSSQPRRPRRRPRHLPMGAASALRGRAGLRRMHGGRHRGRGVPAVERCSPDLLVTDLTLGGRGGIELINLVHRYHASMPILVVSMHDETLYAPPRARRWRPRVRDEAPGRARRDPGRARRSGRENLVDGAVGGAHTRCERGPGGGAIRP